MNKELFLFGTGKISKEYTDILMQLSIEIYGYVDNNNAKWGKYFYGKKIYKPEILKKFKSPQIIIACADLKTITTQLSKINNKSSIININYLIRSELVKLESKIKYFRHLLNVVPMKETVIIDNIKGIWGGSEDWAHRMALALEEQGYNVVLIENNNSEILNELENITLKIDKTNKNISEIYLELIEILLRMRPFTLFNIWGTEVLWAASYIKKQYPHEIHIISSILNDSSKLYQQQSAWDDSIDLYLCISSRIKKNLVNSYGINRKKVHYREPFVLDRRAEKIEYYANNQTALKIGYPCRLSRTQKRADLVPELIGKLEKRNVNYMLNIAGSGNCEKEILNYVNCNNLHNKVKLYGRLSKSELIQFLVHQDIYLNFSEHEGTSLTMLEAMASGCVPVVTDVSGVDDFIINKKNGLISDIGDLDSIADDILFLDKNRKLLETYGRKCIDIVSKRCDLKDYICYIEGLLQYVKFSD